MKVIVRTKIYLVSLFLAIWCSGVSSAIVVQGDLILEDTSNIIKDGLNSVEYLQLDILSGVTYDEVLPFLDTQNGGGWAIAAASDVYNFANAMFSGAMSCDTFGNCGTLPDWYDGKFGGTPDAAFDAFWFLNSGGGFSDIEIDSGGNLNIHDSNRSVVNTDNFITTYGDTYFLYRPSSVPIPVAVPASAYLFVSGLVLLLVTTRARAGSA